MKSLAEFRCKYSHAVNVCGKLNLKTGKCALFNVFEVWSNDKVMLQLFKSKIDGHYILVGGCGKFTAKSSHITFFNSQTFRLVGKEHGFDLVREEEMSFKEMQNLQAIVCDTKIPFYTFD
jgi:hypothetical protein